MKAIRPILTVLAIFAIAGASLLSCAPDEGFVRPDPELVQGFTGGVISRHGSIQVTFAKDMGRAAGEKAAPGLLRFSPGIDGEATWLDARTIQFRPANPLAPGKVYKARVDLAAAYGALPLAEAASAADAGSAADAASGSVPAPDTTAGPKAASYCNFDFAVLRNDFSIALDPLTSPASGGAMELSGVVRTDDSEDPEAIEGLLSVGYSGSAVAVSWKHAEGSKDHAFTLSGIERGPDDAVLGLSWSGSAIASSLKGAAKVMVPAKGKFAPIAARSVAEGESYVEIAFSEPLDPAQDLRGLIEAEGVEGQRIALRGSKVRLYSSGKWPASVSVSVAPGVRGMDGRKLDGASTFNIDFESALPGVRFAGTGVIVPTTQGTTVPIETRNVNAVIVEAVRIFGDNMPQFLQVNDLDGMNELYRVGKVVWKKRIPLKWDASMKDAWVRQGLDLGPLLKLAPTGMLQIRVLFDHDSLEYVCPASHPDFGGMSFPEPRFQDAPAGDASYWDFAEEYYGEGGYYDEDGYSSSYRYREDPCHPSYYKQLSHFVRRNVLVSDIGLSAKAGTDGQLHLFCADLKTAEPLKDVDLKVLDFQLQALGAAKTDGAGMALVKPKEKGFFVVAAKGTQQGYLKIDDTEALSMSLFDVKGDSAPTGVKGLIYGERGVWRPGDKIYLTFLLYDRNKTLPKDYPVQFEFVDPRGQLVGKETIARSVDGFYAIATGTDSEAPTGDWIARVRAGGLTFTKTIKVETIIPNRLKMSLDFGTKKPYLDTEPHDMTLEAKWLHGADASGLAADISATFEAAATSFPGYDGYSFDDDSRRFSTSKQTLWEGDLDAKGRATFSARLEPGTDSPGKLRATLFTRVFEDGGAYSSETFAIDCHPYEQYVGLKLPKGDEARGMLLTDTDHLASIVLVDRDGKAVPKGRVRAELFRVEWRWWWESGSSSSAEYKESSSRTLLTSGDVPIADGKGGWKFQLKYPEWGRYLLVVTDPVSGHSASKVFYMDWPGWAGKARKDSGGAATMLVLQPGKAKYASGETATVSFPSNPNSYALVAVETRGKVAKKQWVKCTGDSTSFSFAVDATMTPNVYVHVTLLQQHLQTANDLPIRLYGVVPVYVEDAATRIVPVIEAPAVIAPGSKVEFKVSEKSGQPMTYTVAVVDEGLLGITRFRAPNPWDSFYKKESSLLKSWDIYQYVSSAYSGKLDSVLAVGGGGEDEMAADAAKKANRFSAVVFYFPATKIEKGKAGAHSFTMPDYVGAVRFMVVAASGAAFGQAEKEVPVKSELMVQSTLPRVLSPGEKLSVPVTFFNYLPGARTIELKLETSGPLSIDGAATRSVKVAGEGEQTVYFPAKVAERLGVATLKVTAASGKSSASSKTEISVRALGTEAYEVVAEVVNPGAGVDREMSLPGMASSNSVTLEVSRFPALDLERRLGYLIAYPHGCIEQTTSSVFPQLYLDRVVSLGTADKEKVQANVKAGLERLKTFLTPEGGFAYWPGESEPSEWGSNYAGHFILEAEKAGYALPEGMKEGWLKFQRQHALDWATGSADELVQAYRLYTLALAKRAEIGAMNRLKEKVGTLQAKWRLAAAYKLAGQDAVALAMVKGVSNEVAPYRELGYTYGSEVRDTAMILETLGLLGDTAGAGKLVIKLTDTMSKSTWLSTQETAYCLIALLPYIGKDASKTPLGFSYSVADGSIKTATLAAGMLRIPMTVGDATKFKIKFTNTSAVNLFCRWIGRGTSALGDEKAEARGIALRVEYLDSAGVRSVVPDELASGKDMVIRLTVTNNSSEKLENLALTHRIPSGWEIVNERLGEDDGEKDGPASAADYVDIRDDRVLTYFGLARGQTKTFTIRVNKSYEGTFYLPSIFAEAMYAADEFRAVIPGRWLKATK